MAITSSILNVFCTFGMALTIDIIDSAIDEWHGRLCSCMPAEGRHFEQLLRQYSAIWQETFLFLSNVTRFLHCFFGNYSQFHTSNFRKVVQQHTEDMVGSIAWVLPEINLAFQQWKNFENPLRIDEVIAMSLVYYFFGTQCRFWFFLLIYSFIINYI